MKTCPECEKDNAFIVIIYTDVFMLVPRDPDKGYITVDGLKGSCCKHCNTICADPEQINHNQNLVKQARSQMMRTTM